MWLCFGLITLACLCVVTFRIRFAAGFHGEEGLRGEIRYRMQIAPQKNRPPRLLIGVALPLDFHFRIRPETPADRWMKSIGLDAELEVPDAELDGSLYFESNDAVLARVLAERAEVRESLRLALRSLSRQGAALRALHAAAGRLWFDVAMGPNRSHEPLVEPLVDALAAMARSLRDTPLRRPLARRDPFMRRAALLLAFSSASAIFAFATMYWYRFGAEPLVAPFELFKVSLLVAAAGLVLLVLGTLAWLGRSARTRLVLVELLTVGAFGLGGTSFFLLREANMTLDFAAPQLQRFAAGHLFSLRARKGGVRYLVTLEQARTPGQADIDDLRVSRTTYDELFARASRKGYAGLRYLGPTRAVVHPGLFGFTWVSTIEPDRGAEAPSR